MKGILFTEFMSFVEAELGDEALDEIIETCAGKLSTDGAYTSVGTYPCEELQALLAAAAHRSGASQQALLESFGQNLASTFVKAYPDYFNRCSNLFDFVAQIDSYIHLEVLKLYPDAELPRFDVVARDDDRIALSYESPRGLHHLAVGLFHGSAAHYREPVQVSFEPAAGDGSSGRFELVRSSPTK